MANRTFVGFSTIEDKKRGRSWVLYDVDLIKRDLLNHFYTRRGERLMRPTYGCNIWEKLMEPMSPALREEIADEVERICALDTRVVVENVQVFHGEQTIIVKALLTYLPFQTVEQFTLNFDRRQES